jgi:DNA-binding NtrC family response regulator
MEKILIIDDEPFVCDNLERILKEENYTTVVDRDGRKALNILKQEAIDLVFLDLNLPEMSGLDILVKMKQWDPELLVIVITSYASVASAVRALKLGAYDYIKKPFKPDVIKLIVRLSLETQHLKKEVITLKKQTEDLLGSQAMIAESPVFLEMMQQVREVARHSETTVLITGEIGTGKDLVARTLHNLSPRAERPFFEINCAALPENLLENELFGYESGAKGKKIGIFEAADNGTLFLDEIGEMSLSLQAKLLRVLEDKKIRRIGGIQSHEIDVRIVAATNQNLQEAVNSKRFREDLYYRLNIVPIHLPPLRERPEDILALTKAFLAEFNRKFGRKFKGIGPGAEQLLLGYRWPGNIREMRHILERICIMHDDEMLREMHLPKEMMADHPHGNLQSLFFDFPIPSTGINLENVVDQFTQYLIEKAMQMKDGNISHVAKLLCIPRGSLRYKLEKYQKGQ